MKVNFLTTFAIVSALVIFPVISQAQCSVSKDMSDTPELIMLIERNENLFENKRYEDGVQLVSARTILTAFKDDKKKMLFSMQICYTATGRMPQIVPRQVKFHFMTDAKELLVIAEKHETENLGGISVERCVYRLKPNEAALIKDNPIYGITLIDNRTDEKLFVSPYVSIFQEQIQCLLKELKTL